ncbi:MAG: hypothetical protein RLZZ568_1275 [Cyanobacteriota bacterium]|jgi:hypothetical protein
MEVRISQIELDFIDLGGVARVTLNLPEAISILWKIT